MCNTFFEIFANTVLKCVPAAGIFGEQSGPGADFAIFGAECLDFLLFGAESRVFGAAGQPGRAYPHCFGGGYVQKWPKTHIPSLIWRRVCTGEGEIDTGREVASGRSCEVRGPRGAQRRRRHQPPGRAGYFGAKRENTERRKGRRGLGGRTLPPYE